MNIRKYLSVIIISIIVNLIFVGCSSSSVDSDSPSEADSNAQESIIKDQHNEELKMQKIDTEDKNQLNSTISDDKLYNEDETEKDIDTGKEKVELSTEAQREINLFLSNFTEVFFPDFEETPSDKILINFGVRHNNINNFSSIDIKDSYGFLSESVVERSIDRFFNLDVQHQKTDTYDYDGTSYIIQLASGAPANMAVVQEMYDNGDGNYTVYFDEVFSHELLDYSLTPKELEQEINNNPDRTQVVSSKKAIVTKHNFEGKSIYKLQEYTTIDN